MPLIDRRQRVHNRHCFDTDTGDALDEVDDVSFVVAVGIGIAGDAAAFAA